jgi:ribonuclease HI
MSAAATIHTDGAARGNPGPAAFAFVIQPPGQAPLEHAETIGTATNNVAEYTALIAALERAGELGLRRLAVFSDSELMVKQFNGEYAVKNPELKGLHAAVMALARRFDSVSLAHVRRAENRRADELCNAVLDGRPPREARPTMARKAKAGPKHRADRHSTVDEQAIACLRTAMAATGQSAPSPEQVWDQLWSVLEDGGVLKVKRPK